MGGYSQVQAELNLLEAATTRNNYDYHLLSGVDFPIKSNKDIELLFQKNSGTNFIQFEKIFQMSPDTKKDIYISIRLKADL